MASDTRRGCASHLQVLMNIWQFCDLELVASDDQEASFQLACQALRLFSISDCGSQQLSVDMASRVTTGQEECLSQEAPRA